MVAEVQAPAYQTRVHAERSELNTKTNKLAAYTKTPEFHALDTENRGLLLMQLRAMRNYLGILDERIALFK